MFLKPDVYANVWHPALGQNFLSIHENTFKFCSHLETLKTNNIEYV